MRTLTCKRSSHTALLLILLCKVSVSALATSSTSTGGSSTSVQSQMPSLPPAKRQNRAMPPLKSSSQSDDLEPLQDIRGGGGLPRKIPPLPTLRDYSKFALPCLGLWVAGPLLSLVDTSFVGLSGSSSVSARNLAALGPATTFFDGATYLFAFLNVATTNLYASARSQHGPNSVQAESVVRTAARVAVTSGIGLMLFLFATCRPLLRLYIGEKAAATAGLLDSAVDYVSIRALSMPTSLLIGVLQAALLGAKDSVTPLIAILYCTVVNVFGDFVLVNRLNMSLRGAAIATTLAQWAATIALVGPARRKLVQNHRLFVKDERAKQSKEGVTGRVFVAFAAPVLTLIIGKIAAFGFLTNAAAGVPGQPLGLASHQIILSLLFFCSPFLEVISQTAQTFLPPYLAPVFDHIKKLRKRDAQYNPDEDPEVQPWLDTSKTVATRLLKVGTITAFCVASIASLIPAFGSGLLTTDRQVQAAVRPMAKYLWMGVFFWAPVAVCEGVLLARRELKFLASIYLASTALLPPALLKVKVSPHGTVGRLWEYFAIFQLFRAGCFMTKIWGGALLRPFRRRRPAALES